MQVQKYRAKAIHNVTGLTAGKIYEVWKSREGEGYWALVNDLGNTVNRYKHRFELLPETIEERFNATITN